MTNAADTEALLRKHNPLLVMLPQDPKRHRPWSRWFEKVERERGDYNPCSAEFFLSFVSQRDAPKHWNPLSFIEPTLPAPTGLAQLRERVSRVSAEATARWELDVAPVRSQDPAQAWTAYGLMLQQTQPSPAPRVYARYVEGARAVLQYWYLYVYNDAPNKHEGDWEGVTLQLDEAGAPLRAGYAGHASGFRRPWARVELVGDRPVVYVARGSHAAYFDYKPGGHRTNSLPSSKGWVEPFESGWRSFNEAFQRTMWFLRLVDHTASKPPPPTGRDIGLLIDPELTVLPELATGQQSDDFWWMKLMGNWGSRHSRLEGTVGPPPPWRQSAKWDTPALWLDTLVEDD